MDKMRPVIPSDALKDTVAILIVLLSVPPPVSTFILFLYILTSSSKAFISKLFSRAFKSSSSSSSSSSLSSSSASSSAGGSTNLPLISPSSSSLTYNTGSSAASSNVNTNNNSGNEEQPSFITPFILVSIVDLTIAVLLKLTAPNVTKVVLVLAQSMIAASLTGNSFRNSMFSCSFIIVLDHLFRLIRTYIDARFSFASKSNSIYLFPHLSNVTFQLSQLWKDLLFAILKRTSFDSSSTNHSYTQQLGHSTVPGYNSNNINNHNTQGHNFSHSHTHNQYFDLFKLVIYILNWLNLLLAIYVILLSFASVFKKNFISKNINSLSYPHNQDHTTIPSTSFSTNPILLNSNKEEKREIKIIDIPIPKELSNTNYDSEVETTSSSNSSTTPASYPEVVPKEEAISSSSIVAENFEIFCNSSFSKPKNSIKAIQPLWSLIATAKAMISRKDIYSGEVELNDSESSLVLSESINKYEDYKFFANLENNDEDNSIGYKKILIFIDYIGETLISFQLKNYNHGSIIVRVNGVLWYQVSRGEFNGEEYFIVGGLTPLSQYDIQFIFEEEEKKYLIDDLIVSTTDSNGYGIISFPNSSSSLKVSSPLITLQESLITTNDNLAKEKLKLKKTRKEITKKLNSYKQDIETLKNKINNSDKNDEKNMRKVLSLRNSLNQAEEDVSKVETETLEIETKENEMNEIYLNEKRKFDSASRNFHNFKNNFSNKISVKKQHLSENDAEIENLRLKREKLVNRIEKLRTETSKIEKEIKDILKSDAKRRTEARNKRIEKRQSLIREFKQEIEKMQNGVIKLTAENEALKSSKVGVINDMHANGKANNSSGDISIESVTT